MEGTMKKRPENVIRFIKRKLQNSGSKCSTMVSAAPTLTSTANSDQTPASLPIQTLVQNDPTTDSSATPSFQNSTENQENNSLASSKAAIPDAERTTPSLSNPTESHEDVSLPPTKAIIPDTQRTKARYAEAVKVLKGVIEGGRKKWDGFTVPAMECPAENISQLGQELEKFLSA